MTAIGVCTNSAQATPPIPVPEPGGIIRMDLAPGEWWSCDGISLAPPFWQLSPVVLGPSPLYLRFAPGADVWVRCSGTAWPIAWYGPIVKVGN
ncbi:hypothetical protein [Antrihabitans stalactiti]|uniref:Uncharacterized protein n=1 Tax=Antrihabitans stalactiti TaxID=2584121 RepID=A0A848KGG7_9NOCA|nr:hypothetical protein [Antrihabitans stalactiti]NMN95017.1 hypothetical protein [Antrihabitans stalactiti]